MPALGAPDSGPISPGYAVPLILQIKWAAFQLLEWLSGLRERIRGKPYTSRPTTPIRPGDRNHLWVFTTTIGELDAVGPFIKRLVRRLENLQLVLLTDHEHYRESFLLRFPGSVVRVIDHHSARARELLNELPPALLVLGEIPCLLSEAPCRFPFAFAFEAKRRGIPVCLVNGWLYQQQPSCLMDRIEKFLFEPDYLRLFDVITVQDESIKRKLVAAGAAPDRVFVTGNIKFDALRPTNWHSRAARSDRLLEFIQASGRPVLTAGCVTNIAEQELVLDAFRACLVLPGNPLLILAPRHPENLERMQILERLLEDRGYRFAFKSRLAGPSLEDTLQCLVVDTLGELKDFYSVSTFSYVGLNKNVLEPLSFGKKVIVTPGWDPVRPGFAVYKLLLAKGFITEVSHEALEAAFVQSFAANEVGAEFRESREYAELIGATDRCLARFESVLTTAEVQ